MPEIASPTLVGLASLSASVLTSPIEHTRSISWRKAISSTGRQRH